jgi:hypothetical protein
MKTIKQVSKARPDEVNNVIYLPNFSAAMTASVV